MTEGRALQKLLTWLSPAFPVGAFAWSAGLETAIAEGGVTDSASLQNWISGALAHCGIRTDAILLAHAWRIACGAGSESPVANDIADLADLCLALTPAAERHRETLLTGDAFVTAAAAWPSDIASPLPDPCPYPVALGALAAVHAIALPDVLLGYVTAAVQTQVSVAVRLVPLGQTAGLRVIAALEPEIARLAAAASTATLEDVGAIAYAADVAQMRHETLEPRLFRS